MYPEDAYLLALGKAYYAFEYYEWQIAYIIDYLGKLKNPGSCLFWGKPKLLGRQLSSKLKSDIEENKEKLGPSLENRALEVQAEYDRLVTRRNHLLHAHPFTNADGEQRLGHAEERHWTPELLSDFTAEVEAATKASGAVSSALRALLAPVP